MTANIPTKQPYLTVIIPQFNELSNLKKGVLESVHSFLQAQSFSYEVIIVDDGSSDDSYEYSSTCTAEYEHFAVIKAEHGGKAKALHEGIQRASGKYTLFTDMDQSTPLEELHKLLPHLNNYSVVIGSRGAKRSGSSFLRKTASGMFTLFRRTLLLRDIQDTQCGFKLFDTKVLQTYFPKLEALQEKTGKGWVVSAFDVELIFILHCKGYSICEVEVSWANEDVSTNKNRKFFKESINMLKQIWVIKQNHLRKKYE